jgi:hypothetical protein
MSTTEPQSEHAALMILIAALLISVTLSLRRQVGIGAQARRSVSHHTHRQIALFDSNNFLPGEPDKKNEDPTSEF